MSSCMDVKLKITGCKDLQRVTNRTAHILAHEPVEGQGQGGRVLKSKREERRGLKKRRQDCWASGRIFKVKGCERETFYINNNNYPQWSAIILKTSATDRYRCRWLL